MVALVLPVKSLDLAKSRLAGLALDPGRHAALALAFALDTACAAAAAPGVSTVLAVTGDQRARQALAAVGIRTTPEPGEEHGLNAAARHGARLLRRDDPAAAIGVLTADLPSLRPAELAAAIAGGRGRRAFCADRHGTGTTLLLVAPQQELRPRFGRRSAAAHAATGATRLNGAWPSLRCDVDTPDDLDHAMTLGLGPHTRQALKPLVRRQTTWI